jgi:hypothetical protein
MVNDPEQVDAFRVWSQGSMHHRDFDPALTGLLKTYMKDVRGCLNCDRWVTEFIASSYTDRIYIQVADITIEVRGDTYLCGVELHLQEGTYYTYLRGVELNRQVGTCGFITSVGNPPRPTRVCRKHEDGHWEHRYPTIPACQRWERLRDCISSWPSSPS